MTVCRASARLACLSLLAIAAAGPAAAQVPLLLPPAREAPARPAAPPAPAAAPAATPLTGPAGIQIEQAKPLDTQGIGLIDGLAEDAWRASDRRLVARILAGLPAPVASMPLRDLVHRVLASRAAPPSGEGGDFAAMRARALRRLGDSAGAAELARGVPQRMADEGLALALIDEAWLAGADERACGLVREAIAASRHPELQKSLMFCQALAGDQNRAQLGLAMLRDQGVPEDAGFVTLLFAAGGDGRGVRLESLRGAGPLSLAMLRGAKLAPPADAALSPDPAVLAALANGTAGTPEFRLAAGERAEAYGAIDAAKLGELYEAVELTAAQVADPVAFARQDGGPRGRAALHKAAKAAATQADRLAALQRLWRHGRERGGFATLARAGAALLADIQAAPEHAAFAGETARALLMAGRADEALGWLRAAASANEDEAAGAWLLATLAGLAWDGPRDPARLDAWRAALEKADARAAPARAALGIALLSGLGHLPPGGARVALSQGAGERANVAMPDPVLWTALHEAAIGGRSAESALLVAHLLGPEGAAGASPFALLAALDGLRAVGFEDTARRLAVEAAIASGL